MEIPKVKIPFLREAILLSLMTVFASGNASADNKSVDRKIGVSSSRGILTSMGKPIDDGRKAEEELSRIRKQNEKLDKSKKKAEAEAEEMESGIENLIESAGNL